MAKKLTLSKIKEDNKQYSIVKRVFLDEEKETYLDIYPNFKPTEVTNVLSELTELSQSAEDNKIEIKNDVFFLFLNAIAVNHFSNLNLSKKDPVKYIEGLLALIDLPNHGFETILKSYPADNWTDLLQKYFEYLKTLTELNVEAAKYAEQNKTESKVDTDKIITEAQEKVKAEENA